MAQVPVDLLGAPWESDLGPDLANIYLHARYYDSALGIFLSPDPSATQARSSVAGKALSLTSVPTANDLLRQGVGTNSYSYAGGDPINRLDPSGLEWFEICDDWKIEERRREDGVYDWIETGECNSWHTEWRDDPEVAEDEEVWKKRRDDKRKKREEEERCRTTGICSEEDFEKWMQNEQCKASWDAYRSQTGHRQSSGLRWRTLSNIIGPAAFVASRHPAGLALLGPVDYLFDHLNIWVDAGPEHIEWSPPSAPTCQVQ